MSEPQLAGPPSLTVTQLSWRAPFAAHRPLMALRRVHFSVVNAGITPCHIDAVTIDPLSRRNGTTVQACLSLQPGADIAAPVLPGGSIDFILSGDIPTEPAAYATTARVLSNAAAALAVPITLNVPAAPVWGVGAMLLGLCLLGIVNLLAGEGEVKTRLHDALAARQDIHTMLESSPAPESRAGDVAEMDHDFDSAVAALEQRRHVSIVDHRRAEAQTFLDAANKLAGALRADLVGRPRGEAEMDDLKQDWKNLQPVLQQIATLPAAPAVAEPGLAGKLDAFLLRFRQRLLQGPAAIVTAETLTELGRVTLEESAGEGDAARDLALNTRLWLRRSALFLNRALTSYRTALVQAGWMLNTDTAMRERAAHDDMAPEFRQQIVSYLDQAAAQMDGDASLDNWKTANWLLDQAWTAQVRGVTQTAKARVDETIAAAGRQTDTSDIDALMAQAQAAPKPHTPAMKQAFLTQVLGLWRGHVAQMDEAPARVKFEHELDALQALVSAGKIQESVQPYRILLNDWTAWNGHLVQREIARLDHPRCLEIYADLERNAARIEATLRERPAGPDMALWDRELDQIRLDMQREGPDAETVTEDCINPLLAIDRRANSLSGIVFAAGLADIPLTALTRVRLAQASGIAQAISATEANKDRPRSLTLTTLTPAWERVVGRTLTFNIGGQDPVWGKSTDIKVYFGDGTQPSVTDAEAVRQGNAITHEYHAARTENLTVAATEDAKPGAPAPTILGSGKATILIAPSPVSDAQVLADEFINLRFGLALLISLTVYYWRYHSRSTVFGARGYDYVEAFALGFVANAAVSNFPDAIKAFAPT